MHPPIKNQADINVDNPTLDASDESEGGPDGNKDMARQEFKDEADLHYMLQRFGVVQPRGAPAYGQWDDTIDLQDALEATRMAQRAFRQLPEDLQKKVGNVENLLNAVATGQLEIKDEPAPDPTPQPPTPAPDPTPQPPTPA